MLMLVADRQVIYTKWMDHHSIDRCIPLLLGTRAERTLTSERKRRGQTWDTEGKVVGRRGMVMWSMAVAA